MTRPVNLSLFETCAIVTIVHVSLPTNFRTRAVPSPEDVLAETMTFAFCAGIGLVGRKSHTRRLCRHRPAFVSKPFSTRACMNPYEELGVSPDADDSTIKRAYRKAALERHPDVSKAPDAREAFQRAQDAYRMLSDPAARRNYDRVSTRSGSGSSGSSFYGGDGGAAAREYARNWRKANPMPEDLDDSLGSVLSDIFGSVTRGASEKRPSVLSDVMDFLERGVGIGGGSGNGSDSVDRIKSQEVLESEIRECQRAVKAAEARARGSEADSLGLNSRVEDWNRRASNSEQSGDYAARDAAREMVAEIETQRTKLEGLTKKFREVAAAARAHESRVRQRLEKVQSAERSGGGVGKDREGRMSSKSKVTVEDELERMKREMNL